MRKLNRQKFRHADALLSRRRDRNNDYQPPPLFSSRLNFVRAARQSGCMAIDDMQAPIRSSVSAVDSCQQCELAAHSRQCSATHGLGRI